MFVLEVDWIVGGGGGGEGGGGEGEGGGGGGGRGSNFGGLLMRRRQARSTRLP